MKETKEFQSVGFVGLAQGEMAEVLYQARMFSDQHLEH